MTDTDQGKTVKKFRRLFRKGGSIQHRLQASFCLLICVVLSVSCMISFIEVRKNARATALANSKQALGLLSENINGLIASIDNVARQTLVNEQIRDYCEHAETLNEYETITLTRELNEGYFGSLFLSNDNISSVIIHPLHGKGLAFGKATVLAVSAEDSARFNEDIRSATAEIWYPSRRINIGIALSQDVISMTRRIYSRRTRSWVGTLEVQTDESRFLNTYIRQSDQNGGHILILDQNCGSIYAEENGTASDGEMPLGSFDPAEYKDGALIRINGEECLLMCFRLKNGWILVHYQPVKNLYRTAAQINRTTIIVGIFLMLLSILFATKLTRQFLAPLHRAVEVNFSETPDSNGDGSEDNEIVRIFNNYRQMLMRLKEAEADALRAQITPHFLYNTLNSIRMRALLEHCMPVAKMISQLSGILELTLNNRSEFIPLEQEIAILQSYVELQKMRSDHTFTLQIRIEDERLKSCLVPKMCLQTLTENSILHGIEPKESEGRLEVFASEENGDLRLEVRDNGVGMTQERIEEVLQGQGDHNKRRFNRIGIHNVDERIKLCFGDSYGVDIHSVPGQGCSCIVRMPIRMSSMEGEEND